MLNVRTEMIGPQKAQELLDDALPNRRISKRSLSALVSDMKNERFKNDGSPIRLNESGKMYDGQHRCLAIVQSGVTLEMVIISGVSEEAMTVTDTGLKRTLPHVLTMRGEINANVLASALATIWRYRNPSFVMSNTTPSHQEALSILISEPGIRDCVQLIGKRADSLRLSHGGCAAYYHEMLSLNDEEAKEDSEDFFGKLFTGVDLIEGSPILAFRRISLANSIKPKIQRKSRVEMDALLIRAWNRYRKGEDNVKILRFARGGAHPDQFPRIE